MSERDDEFFSTHAAAHFSQADAGDAPAESPPSEEASEQPESGERNGQETGHDTTYAFCEADSLLTAYEGAAPFWHLPLEPGVFYDTPLLVNRKLADTERVVLQLESYLRNAGYEVEAVELRMNYTHWVKIPATQYEWLRHELEPLRKKRLQELQQAQRDLEQAQMEFTQAMAAAKIPFPKPAPPKKRGKTPPTPEPINAWLVERALNEDFASDEEVCGEQGVAPTSLHGSRWTELGQWFLELFAPLAAGLLLGVNLGVITGLLSLEVLQRGESLWLVALAAVIGLFVEKLVGNTAYSLGASAAQASERREGIDTAAPFPTMRSTWRVAFFVMVVSLLTIAIATVDALGLHMLYQERLQEAQLTGGRSSEEVPLWVFFIAGLIISAPYIVYKAVKGWREPEIRQREARVRYLRWKHVERRRAEPAVQHAFDKAGEVEKLSERCTQLKQEQERIEARLDSARTELIGSTQKFREYWDSLVAWLSKERALHASESARRNGQFRRNSAHGETLLQKLTGLFRR